MRTVFLLFPEALEPMGKLSCSVGSMTAQPAETCTTAGIITIINLIVNVVMLKQHPFFYNVRLLREKNRIIIQCHKELI